VPDPLGRVDLRSDTVTRPTAEMRRAMADAEVGDDGFGEDPTVARLEAEVAARLGKEASLFVPSGTMANQVALRVLAPAGSTVLCGRRQHVVVREAGATGANVGAQLVTLDDGDGTIDPAEVHRWRADAAAGWAAPAAVFVEDTHGEAGGRVWPLDRLAAVAAAGLPVHLDGARLWNAAVAAGHELAQRAAPATTVATSLSKALGAPVGSLLSGPLDLVARARQERKRLGGSMRQVGVLAAAGLVAIGRIGRLVEDHERARRLAVAAASRWPGSVDPAVVETNIVLVSLPRPGPVLRHLHDRGVLALASGASTLRLVTHPDVDDDDVERATAALASAPDGAAAEEGEG
jgi:threonine aldolase